MFRGDTELAQAHTMAMRATLLAGVVVAVGLRSVSAAALTLSTADKTALLKWHNTVRCAKGLKLLAWSTAAQQSAETYAKNCQYKHSTSSQRPGMGENLYASSGHLTAARDATAAPNAWNSEEVDWKCGSKQGAAGSCAQGKVCGHYTQNVWGATTEVGCAIVQCSANTPFSSFPKWTYVVCQYKSAGNYAGQAPFPAANCTGKSTCNAGGCPASWVNDGMCDESGYGCDSAWMNYHDKSKKASYGACCTKGSDSNDCKKAEQSSQSCLAKAKRTSLPKCGQCFSKSQCGSINGKQMYCCPYMKRCVSSGSDSCSMPIARCQPMCRVETYPFCNCNSGFPKSWPGYSCLKGSASSTQKSGSSGIPEGSTTGGDDDSSPFLVVFIIVGVVVLGIVAAVALLCSKKEPKALG